MVRGITVRDIQPVLFTKIMALPEDEREDLLEFLGATPVTDSQLEGLIAQLAAKAATEAARGKAADQRR